MRLPISLLAVPLAVAVALAASAAGDDDPQTAARKALAPRPIVFSKSALSLQQALAELTRDTGNAVGDQRRDRTNPTLQLPVAPLKFWPALDEIARASGIGLSPYFADRGVGLTDTPYRPVPTAYGGIFRLAEHRVAVVRDEQTQTRHVQLAIDVAWEPRFQPFYLELKQLKVIFAPDAKKNVLVDKVPGRGPVHVAGRSAIELDVQTAAPDRSCPRIEALEGMVWAVGPSKMLSFNFAKLVVLKPGEKPAAQVQTQEGVSVTLASIKRQGDALVVKVQIENPKGGPGFESYQSWLDNNRIVLAHTDRKRLLAGIPIRDEVKGRRAEVEYEFAESVSQSVPANLIDWSLRYETPGRIVELEAPFVLKELALP